MRALEQGNSIPTDIQRLLNRQFKKSRGTSHLDSFLKEFWIFQERYNLWFWSLFSFKGKRHTWAQPCQGYTTSPAPSSSLRALRDINTGKSSYGSFTTEVALWGICWASTLDVPDPQKLSFSNVLVKTYYFCTIPVTSFVKSPPFFLSLRPVVQTHSFTKGFSISAPNVWSDNAAH